MSEDTTQLINQGLIETRNLAQCLAVDQTALATAIAGQLDESLGQALVAAAQATEKQGISKRIAALGLALGQWLELAAPPARQRAWSLLQAHPSDTVRSWAAFANAYRERNQSLASAIHSQLHFACDSHFGVREWAWIALRPLLSQDLATALSLLRQYTLSEDPLIRRFSIEILRPRGVWCEHIGALKSTPELAEPLLIPLLAESQKYPQDSVANWLNDASKTRPDWVRQLFQRYPPSCKASHRIHTRATRSLSH
ncbi:DNA alkylation repair protein [Pseudomonas protegens]|uniref:DNA alkylation repair protein n=1 Tax=Pseudomonas protegens TaxID=380021 RepID=UPI00390625DC